MASIELAACKRSVITKTDTKKLRNDGRMPGVVYRKGNNIPISVDFHDFNHIVHHHNIGTTIIELNLDSEKIPTLIKDMQGHPVTWENLHVDFLWIDLTHEIETVIPITLIGTSKGVKEGGVLEHMLREVVVKCSPNNIPESFECDISGLGIHDSCHVSDLKKIEGTTILTDLTQTIAMVTTARSIEDEAAAAAEGPDAEGAASEALPKSEGGEKTGKVKEESKE